MGFSPLNSLLSLGLLGTGIVIVIGLWNFLLLGSSVTIGLNVALLPRIFLTSSILIGCAYEEEPETDAHIVTLYSVHFSAVGLNG